MVAPDREQARERLRAKIQQRRGERAPAGPPSQVDPVGELIRRGLDDPRLLSAVQGAGGRGGLRAQAAKLLQQIQAQAAAPPPAPAPPPLPAGHGDHPDSDGEAGPPAPDDPDPDRWELVGGDDQDDDDGEAAPPPPPA